jgi:hypothetical protein
LISNFVFGQENVSIDKNIIAYEQSDDYERFDDVEKTEDDYKGLVINIGDKSDLKIENSYSAEFVGYNILFKIDEDLKIKEVSYNYWTDNIDLENPTTYEIRKAKLILNQNPFRSLNGLCGIYELEIDHYQKNKKIKTERFKGKFKTFRGIKENSPEYKWVLDQNQVQKNVQTDSGIYLNPDTPPSLKSDTKELIEIINNIEGIKPRKIQVIVVINDKGKIEKEPIRFSGQMSEPLKNEITKLLIKMTEWYPACANQKEVKSQIPIVIGTE